MSQKKKKQAKKARRKVDQEELPQPVIPDETVKTSAFESGPDFGIIKRYTGSGRDTSDTPKTTSSSKTDQQEN